MNPYVGNNPYTMQSADIGYPNVQYQPSTQDTSMQDMFHNEAMNQMQQLSGGQSTGQGGFNPMALANALRNNQDSKFDISSLWKSNTPITASALTSGMTPTGVVGLGQGPSGYGLGTGSTANVGANLFPIYGS